MVGQYKDFIREQDEEIQKLKRENENLEKEKQEFQVIFFYFWILF